MSKNAIRRACLACSLLLCSTGPVGCSDDTGQLAGSQPKDQDGTAQTPPGADSPGAESPAPESPAPPEAPARHAWIVSPSEPPVAIHGLSIRGASAALRSELEANGCADLLDASSPEGEPIATLDTGAELGDAFLDWIAADVGQAEGFSGGIRVASGDVNGDATDLRCVVSIASAHVVRAMLTARKAGDAQLTWEIKPGAISVVPKTEVGVEGLDVQAPNTTAGLLLPAVQKVRELPPPPPKPTSNAEEGYALFDRSAPPAPFDLSLSEDQVRELYPAGTTTGSTIALVHLRGATRGFALKYPMSHALVGPGQVRFKPGKPLGVVRPAAPGDGGPSLDELKKTAETTLKLLFVDRLLQTLDGQPSLTADPSAATAALTEHWTKGGGTITSFDAGLESFLARAADEEGLWAYARLEAAALVFDRLDPSEGRRPDGLSAEDILAGRVIVAAAREDAEGASFSMLPGSLLTFPKREGHDYRLALEAVHRFGEASPLLIGAKPHQLIGVEPDEIDLAVSVANEGGPSVRSVDALAKRFLEQRDAVLASAAPTATELAALEAATSELRNALADLRTATEARFAVTR